MDSIEVFIGKIEHELDELQKGSLKPDTDYRQIPEWSSMYSLILIALAETEYDVAVTGEDLRQCKTVNDIYSIIKNRKK